MDDLSIFACWIMMHVASEMTYTWDHPNQVQLPFKKISGVDTEQLCQISQKEWDKIADTFFFKKTLNKKIKEHYICKFGSGTKPLVQRILLQLNQIRGQSVHYLPWCHKKYPQKLRDIADPPLALTCQGDLLRFESDSIGIVGSRKASGKSVTESFELGLEVAKKCHVVVSGGAFGCDISAHQGVLKADSHKVHAIVVQAGGLLNPYPTQNRRIFQKITSNGGLMVSERLMDHIPRAFDFPIRNRIISGLSQVVVVMQAAQKSGALITARKALEQGREVVVLIHPAEDVRCLGGLQLLEEGALGFHSAKGFIEGRVNYCVFMNRKEANEEEKKFGNSFIA